MKDIKAYTLRELRDFFESMGESGFRADQVFKWIWTKGVLHFDAMTDLPKTLRGRLSREFRVSSIEPVHVSKSKDGSIKYLFRLEDGRVLRACSSLRERGGQYVFQHRLDVEWVVHSVQQPG